MQSFSIKQAFTVSFSACFLKKNVILLNSIVVWFKANKLPLNEGKTKYKFFHTFCQKDNILLKLPMLAINWKVIERTTSIKVHGTLFDEHLSWKNYISVVKNKVSKNITTLHKTKHIFRKGGLKYNFPLYIVT